VAWDITVTFTGPYAPVDVPQQYPGNVTIGGQVIPCIATKLQWRRGANPLPAGPGVYVVENLQRRVYAGEAAAQTIVQRYVAKAAAVHEVGLSRQRSQTLANQRIWAGVVGPVRGTTRRRAVHMVEHWLIRYLLISDYVTAQANPQLPRAILNNKKTDGDWAPQVGMTLRFTTPPGMNFLWDNALQDLSQPRRRTVANANGTARSFSYTYQPGAPF
jgi:hypothetical protein